MNFIFIGNITQSIREKFHALGVFFFCLGCVVTGYADASIAYTSGLISSDIYRVDLTAGSASTVVNIAGNPVSIALLNSSTAYLATQSTNFIYRINVVTGTATLVTPSSIVAAGLRVLALANSTTAYTVGNSSNHVYRVDLTNEGMVLCRVF